MSAEATQQFVAKLQSLAARKPWWKALIDSIVEHRAEIVSDIGDDGTVEGGLAFIIAAALAAYEEKFSPLEIPGVPEFLELKFVEPAVHELIGKAIRGAYDSLDQVKL